MNSEPEAPDVKQCPVCAEDIKAAAIKCKHCGEMFDSPPEASSTSGPSTPSVVLEDIKPQQPKHATGKQFALILVLVLALGFSVIYARYAQAKRVEALTGCKSNLRNFGTAMEMYSTDNRGFYPPRLELLTPYYFETLPTCPTGPSYTDEWAFLPESYRVVCNGDHTDAGQVERLNTSFGDAFAEY